ncbi:MAG: Cys-tRNA(Pro) deacylase [Lachnospiraceae bacterium]|nr:Cys-tRNA(Pro) deacylase [Lachnospiraceae bacterium]
MMKKEEKTNVLRVLDGKKIAYESHAYEPDATLTGEEIAGILGEDAACVFKTLVTQGKSGQYFVFVVPVNAGLDLKKAAKAAGEKSIAMIKQKELLPLTGYVHGGCSPIGMKKQFPAFIHETAATFQHIYVSAGKVGMQVELSPQDLIRTANLKLADVAFHDATEEA